MMPVYAWPPIAPRAWQWTVVEPIDVSRSLLTGRRYASAGLRARREVRMEISGVAKNGGGYSEALKRVLRGGANLVRLRNYPMVWRAAATATRSAEAVIWTTGAESLAWQTGGAALAWFTGTVLTGAPATMGGFPSLTISGLPAGVQVAQAGEPVTVWSSVVSLDYATIQTRYLLRPMTADADGVAVAVLDAAVTNTGRVDIGFETGVFEALSLPRAVRPVGGDWAYDWEFREVFADEVGGFEEINPW